MISVRTLENGVRVVAESIPFVKSVSFGLWVNNGSRHETSGNNGISHFLEHMMFKGTEKRTALEIADTMDAVGGQLNAFTSKECTCYFTRTLDTHLDIAIDVISDMFFNSKFDQGEIDKERNVILEEINMYEDSPDDLCVDLLHEKAYGDHPLAMSILGPAENISAFNREDFIGFTNNRYTPGNVIISIAGNFETEVVMEKMAKVFGGFKSPLAKTDESKAVYSPGFSVKEKDIEQVHLAIGYPGIKSGTDEAYATAAVNAVLGGGMSSRLFQKLREERGLVYSVYSYNASYVDTGLFVVYAALNQSQLQEAMSLINQEVAGMLTNKITSEQLTKVKEQLKSNYLLSLENVVSRMNSLGRGILLFNRIITPDELVAKIDAINMDSFYAVCEKIFKPDQVSISLVGRDVKDGQVFC